MLRTWIIRQFNPVWVRKLADIVTSLWLEMIKLDKEWFNVILLYGNILKTNIWNKWENESVNRLLTLINQLLLWKKKGTKLDSKWKISKSPVLHQWGILGGLFWKYFTSKNDVQRPFSHSWLKGFFPFHRNSASWSWEWISYGLVNSADILEVTSHLVWTQCGLKLTYHWSKLT